MSHWKDELRDVGVRSEPDALRAANLSPLQKMSGIQPGEQIELFATFVSGGEVRTNRRVITAPEKPGTFTRTIPAGEFGEQKVTFEVVPKTEPRDISTNPAESVDVSSAPGKQAVPDVQSGTSNKAATFAQSDVNNFAKAMKNDGNGALAGLLVVLGLVAAILIGGS